jgi:hypothetical protein
MTNDEQQDLAAMSGESVYRAPRALELNEVSLNGDDRDGGYFRKKILIGKPKDEKPEEIHLTKPADDKHPPDALTVVFLKIRRRLIERGKKGEILRSTSEHNHKGDVVSLFEANSKERITGIASDLREKYEGLRTVQIVYALLCVGPNEPELVKLIVKGASLGSEAKAESTTDFYSYISSFNGDEHFYQYKTKLTPVLEEGQRSYYAINFERGERLSEKSYAFAVEKMKEVHAKCVEIDAARAQRVVKAATVDDVVLEPEEESEPATVDYPKDDINPDDISF